MDAIGYGTVYQLRLSDSGWSERIIHSFCHDYGDCTDGANPLATLVFDAAGNAFGTTSYGGDANSWGVVYQLTPSGEDWIETVLCTHGCLGDSYPQSEVTLDRAGRILRFGGG